ncbi:hypothetical protein BgAZ_102760 [Babesia gibsoni]|uniref:Uncharacterized protein n=1 Tax=Babesia gibsoni TaxID=33632 RepID=A0AAD8URI0_BABGI|nr:hypothetical protein BgAZ_102760 [Babesia gibsoni]
MEGVPVEYLDLHSEAKCGIFGICCLVTLLAFCFVLYRVSVSPTRMPWNELGVILLSCMQLLLGVIFYFGSQHPYLHILNKAIKVAQAEIISWSCIVILLANNSTKRKSAFVLFNIFNASILVVLIYGCFTVDVTTINRNAKIGIFMSTMWFAMSMAVLFKAFKIRKKLDVLSLLRFEDENQPSFEGSKSSSLGSFGKVSGDIVESYSDTRYKQFMLLVIVEAVTAVGTLMWDIILYCSIHQSRNSDQEQLEIPLLIEILHVTSNIILLLIPNWTVFYVFYWVQRRNYNHISANWDINMNSMSEKGAAFV